MEQNNNDEIDLGLILKKVSSAYKYLLIGLYRGYKFILRNWIIFLILIVIGGLLGYFLDSNSKAPKSTSLVVQVNFDASNYVYDAVEQLQNKIAEYDTVALKKMGFYRDHKLVLFYAEIQPIVDVLAIIKEARGNDRGIEALLEQSKYEDDMLTSEIFIPEYKSHRIQLITSHRGTSETIDSFLTYLNDNEIFNEIKKVKIENTKSNIAYNTQSIAFLDSIVKTYGIVIKNNAPPNQIYFNTYEVNNGNIHLMFREKRLIQEEIDELSVELLKYNSIVTLLNKPLLQETKSIFNKKIIMYPFFFIVIFLLVRVIRHFFKIAKELSIDGR